MLQHDYNLLTHQIISCAIEVHKILGPGLMESVYELCLYEEIKRRGLYIERQKVLPITYKGYVLDKEFIIDHLVEDEIVL